MRCMFFGVCSYRSMAGSQSLYQQIPYNKECAQPTRCKECVPSRAGSLCGLLELLVPASDILGRLEGVCHQLVDVCRLCSKIVDE